ncbi:unnamed protein product [Haemonchus placei]|uniref:Uncharacterized protein n=1 Tax=Haemonchus placei TaxID=6290 RepID=A0A158QQA0_HAEPC|nr:unnamed protein product [Haemonchus placei]
MTRDETHRELDSVSDTVLLTAGPMRSALLVTLAYRDFAAVLEVIPWYTLNHLQIKKCPLPILIGLTSWSVQCML